MQEQIKSTDNKMSDVEANGGVTKGGVINDKTFLPIFEQTGDDWGNVSRPT